MARRAAGLGCGAGLDCKLYTRVRDPQARRRAGGAAVRGHSRRIGVLSRRLGRLSRSCSACGARWTRTSGRKPIAKGHRSAGPEPLARPVDPWQPKLFRPTADGHRGAAEPGPSPLPGPASLTRRRAPSQALPFPALHNCETNVRVPKAS